jgi:hypothetical protein
VPHRDAVQLPESWLGRQLVDDAGREQHLARGDARAVGQRRDEAAVGPHGVHHGDVAHGDGLVRHELLAADAPQLRRRQAVAREEAVHRRRRGVARMPRVAQQHATPASPQHERGRQPRGAAADDEHLDGRGAPRGASGGPAARGRDARRPMAPCRNCRPDLP